MSTKSAVLITVGAVAGLGIAAAIAIPAASEWYENRHDESSTYASGSAAKSARPSVPRWLPDTASDVEYAMKTTGGERLLKAKLADAKLPEGCKALEKNKTAAKPEIEAKWFPKGAESKAAARCERYYAYTDGTTLYAWQTNADWLEGNRAGENG
ncbi:hypothetical protein ACN20G_02505 [Streptomyces sp. BI20]|uniref:hypothetical protein n=1 Tax=Streptomyces sp. BI20 TaxID=3403460 RepID=UPI003C7819DD